MVQPPVSLAETLLPVLEKSNQVEPLGLNQGARQVLEVASVVVLEVVLGFLSSAIR